MNYIIINLHLFVILHFKHNIDLDIFFYHGLDRFSDDIDQEWNERSYSMSDFYHQYIRFEDKYKDQDIERGIVHTYVVNPNDVDHSSSFILLDHQAIISRLIYACL